MEETMKKLIAILLTSSVIAMPVAAFAQTVTTPVDPGAGVSAGAGASAGAAGSVSTNASSTGQFAWNDLMTSLNVSASGTAGADMGTMISGIAAGSNVQIIDITSLDGAPVDAGSQIQAALSTGAALTDLHTAISANGFLVQQLEAGGHSVDDVVAVSAAADGGFLLYVQPVASDVNTLPAPAGSPSTTGPSTMAPAAPAAPAN
jgi:hypothetical protein